MNKFLFINYYYININKMSRNAKTITHKNSNTQESNIIDLTLSDDDANNIPNNNYITSKKHFKKRKLNTYDNEDDDNDDIFEMYPQTQNFVFNELPEKKKKVFSIFKNNPPKKKRKEYKLSNLQNSFDRYLNSQKATTIKNNSTTEIDSSLWIERQNPFLVLYVAIPPLIVPRCEL